METDAMITKPQPRMTHRMVPAVLPLLFIAITYVDPGKWVAAVEGGARFGYDLILLMFVFSLAAVLCHYLSACIAVVTGRDLAQICSEEYDTITCIFLGVQAELSMIALDLSMILGIAHALNLTFGIGLFTCVLLTSIDAFLFPVFSNLLETGKAKFMCMWLATVALLSYLFGVVMSQRDTSYSMGGMVTGFSGQSAFALMSLLSASIIPHNFYLHSSMVQLVPKSVTFTMSDDASVAPSKEPFLDHVANEIEDMNNDFTEMQGILAILRGQLADSLSLLSNPHSRVPPVNPLEIQVRWLEEEKTEFEAQVERLEEENMKFEVQVERLEEENRKFEVQVKRLEEENRKLHEENRKLRSVDTFGVLAKEKHK